MMTLALLGGQVGVSELLVILCLVLVLFGAKRLPEIARALGRSISEFKKGRDEIVRSFTESDVVGERAEKKIMNTDERKISNTERN